MACRVAIVDDSSVDAAFVEDILKTWAQDRKVSAGIKKMVSSLDKVPGASGGRSFNLPIRMPAMIKPNKIAS